MPITTNPFLVKALALALAASQIFIQNSVKTSFDAEKDQTEVLSLLSQGCQRMRETLGAEMPLMKDLDPDQFLSTLMQNADTLGQSKEIYPGLKMSDAKSAYDIFCSNKVGDEATPILKEMLSYYNTNLQNLPDAHALVNYKLPEFSVIDDVSGHHFTDAYRESRRHVVPLQQIPDLVQKAFLAAEDKNFYRHHGVDEHGLMRAALSSVMESSGSHMAGGSTITQQLVKNLLVGSAVTFERKLREMVLANQIEGLIGKDKILELYLNYVFLGRASWGVEMGSENWFHKPLNQLTPTQAAFLAGLPKGPMLYNPDVNVQKSKDRTQFVLDQMHTDTFLNDSQYQDASKEAQSLAVVPKPPPSVATDGQYFIDEVVFFIKQQLGIDADKEGLKVESTLHPSLQALNEAAVQEGLAQFEISTGHFRFLKPVANLAKQIEQAESAGSGNDPGWLKVLSKLPPPLSDVHWPLAVVLQTGKKGNKVGLSDGRTLPLKVVGKLQTPLQLDDLIYVHMEMQGKAAVAALRHPPEIEGASLVVENKTGNVVSMVGGFSHSLSQLDRTVHMVRQPGSTVKPLTYLAALQAGLQPNTLVLDGPITFPGSRKPWSPSNYESNDVVELVTMRRGLEESRNRVTARLLTLFDGSSEQALTNVVELMRACGIPVVTPHWSVVIGGMDVSMIDIATCFATLANGGYRPNIHLFNSIKKDDKVVYEARKDFYRMPQSDDVSFYQLRTLMQGVVVRGTAAKVNRDLADIVKRNNGSSISDFVAGKTGTSQKDLDTWFVGFTNDLTIVVWVGYDNPDKKNRRSVGARATGGTVAAPIWEQIFRATLQEYPLTRLPEPSAQVAADIDNVLVAGNGRVISGVSPAPGLFPEYLRKDAGGQPIDTWEKFYQMNIPPPQPYQDGPPSYPGAPPPYGWNQQEDDQ